MRNRIKQVRTARGMTQKQLGALVGVSYSRICVWEQERAFPSPALQQDLAIALGVSISKLFPDYVPEPPSPRRMEICTAGGLRQSAAVQVGQQMRRRMALYGGAEESWRPCTVVETRAGWFRVVLDKSGISECFSYQAFLTEGGLRRMG